MRLHILGRGGGCPGPGGACSGYLLEAGGRRVLLECGPGVVGRLQTICPPEALDAIVLTHLHADHVLDLIPLAYWLMMRCQTVGAPERRLVCVPLFLPRGGRSTLEALSRALGHTSWRFADVAGASQAYHAFREALETEPDLVLALLPPTEYELDGSWEADGLRVRTCPVVHGGPAVAVRTEHDVRSVVFSGDTAACPALVELARGADLLLCEAMATAASAPFYDGHMSAAQAGAVAATAGVGRLVLTHLAPWADEGSALAEARAAFSGPVAIAREGDDYEVGPAWSGGGSGDAVIARTEGFVRERLEGEGTGHDWWHVDRVRRLALRLGEAEGEPFDRVVVELAALLHDVADWKFHDGDEEAGPRAAAAWLRTLGVDEATIAHVTAVIAETSFKGAGVPTPARTPESAVVQDADRLDALGAIGIARTFAYGGFRGHPLHDPAIAPELHESAVRYKGGAGPTINHFYEKLLLLKDRMNTAAGRRLAEERHRVLEQFLARFLDEWDGRA